MSAQGREPSRIPLTQAELLAGNKLFALLDGSNTGGRHDAPALINRNFRWWQRGTSFASVAYNADRWTSVFAGAAMTVSRQAFSIGEADTESVYFARVAASGGTSATDYALFRQPIESVKRFAGKRVCIRGLARRSSGSGAVAVEVVQAPGTGGSAQVNTYGGQFVPSTVWAPFSVFVNIPTLTGLVLGTSDYLGLFFWLSGGSSFNARTGNLGLQTLTVDFADIDIFEVASGYGDQIQPFRQYPIDLDFLRCLRYYEKSYSINVFPGNNVSGGQQTVMFHAPQSYYISQPFQVRKRAVPSMAVYDYSGVAGKVSYTTGPSWIAGGQTNGISSISDSAWQISGGVASAIAFQLDWTAEAEF